MNNKSKKTIVTGGAGFIGSHLVDRLLDDGHEVIGEATNGRQAINMYKELKPDLVTMDISMPILSGVEAVKEIIGEDPDAKIIMISAECTLKYL